MKGDSEITDKIKSLKEISTHIITLINQYKSITVGMKDIENKSQVDEQQRNNPVLDNQPPPISNEE